MKEVKLFVGGYCNAPKEVAETLKFEYLELEIKKTDEIPDKNGYCSFLFEGKWTGIPEEFKRMTHHAEGLYEVVRNIQVEVFADNEWTGGDQHSVFEREEKLERVKGLKLENWAE